MLLGGFNKQGEAKLIWIWMLNVRLPRVPDGCYDRTPDNYQEHTDDLLVTEKYTRRFASVMWDYMRYQITHFIKV